MKSEVVTLFTLSFFFTIFLCQSYHILRECRMIHHSVNFSNSNSLCIHPCMFSNIVFFFLTSDLTVFNLVYKVTINFQNLFEFKFNYSFFLKTRLHITRQSSALAMPGSQEIYLAHRCATPSIQNMSGKPTGNDLNSIFVSSFPSPGPSGHVPRAVPFVTIC
jgi:hypothetical protein